MRVFPPAFHCNTLGGTCIGHRTPGMIEAVTPADGTIATLGDLYGPPSDILGVLWAYSETSVSQVSQDITGLPISHADHH